MVFYARAIRALDPISSPSGRPSPSGAAVRRLHQPQVHPPPHRAPRPAASALEFVRQASARSGWLVRWSIPSERPCCCLFTIQTAVAARFQFTTKESRTSVPAVAACSRSRLLLLLVSSSRSGFCPHKPLTLQIGPRPLAPDCCSGSSPDPPLVASCSKKRKKCLLHRAMLLSLAVR